LGWAIKNASELMSSAPPRTSFSGGAKCAFHNTLWSVVMAAGESDSAKAMPALEKLAGLYWPPIYAFLRRRGCDRERARDLTQSFFAYLLKGNLFKKADPQRGHFRSFLLGTLKRFVSHEIDKEKAIRRGGDQVFVSIDEEQADGLCSNQPFSTLSPDKVFERQWALTAITEAISRVEEEYRRGEMLGTFMILRPYLTGDAEMSCAELGRKLNKTDAAARLLIFRFRARFRKRLCAVIADTVSDSKQVERELEHLQEVLRGC
jgi:DNA-directed RNA polymerase specialized sigma24 family protein